MVLLRASTVNIMNCDLHNITYVAPRTLLLVELYEVIYLAVDVAVKRVSTDTTQDRFNCSSVRLLLESLSLTRVENKTFGVVYQSSIAFKLSSVLRRNTLELAYQILEEFHRKNVNFCQEDMTSTDRLLSDFTGTVFSDGLLQFELGNRGLAIWLQYLVEPLSQSHLGQQVPFSISSLEDKTKLFFCQHSYARCCSLLRQAHRLMITLNRLDDSLDHPWIVLAPDPIPWLTAHGDLSLTDLAEQRLISQLVTIADDLSDLMTSPQSCLASATLLSYRFQEFYQACRIFGTASNSHMQLSQGRLGLVIITQRLLKQLIEVGLNQQAPSEL